MVAIKEPKKPTVYQLESYPSKLSSSVALYWDGISIKAARANSASFLEWSIFFDIMSVKFTNYRIQKKAVSQSNNEKKEENKEKNHIVLPLRSACLEIIKGPSRDVVIEFPHHVPWPISNPDYYNWQGVITAN